jgi:hypothetical protein
MLERISFFACLLASLAGCSGSATHDASDYELSASDYDQSCQTADECIAVFIGELCAGDCRCANDAINQSSLDEYTKDIEPASDCTSELACKCAAPQLACEAGRCKLTHP